MQQPRYSDDGRFYWDGQRWVPVPPPPVIYQQRDVWDSCANKGCLIGVIVFCGVIVVVAVLTHLPQ